MGPLIAFGYATQPSATVIWYFPGGRIQKPTYTTFSTKSSGGGLTCFSDGDSQIISPSEMFASRKREELEAMNECQQKSFLFETPNTLQVQDHVQTKLNIEKRDRFSLFPWRGQFSPLLVEFLIDEFAPKSKVILDPFCGSGTVIYEAARKGIYGIGAEINPAGWLLSSISGICGQTQKYKDKTMQMIEESIDTARRSKGLFPCVKNFVERYKKNARGDEFFFYCLSVSVLMGMKDKDIWSKGHAINGMLSLLEIMKSVSSYNGKGECLLSDARKLPIKDSSVDAIITSPPYINVFNYHQNYRPAVESLGWKPLVSARSEIGANRKFRQNRFLTVVQYFMDMSQSISEMSRVCKKGALIVMVVGKESNVLGVPFFNGSIIRSIIKISGSFELVCQKQRVFKNKFGKEITEEILMLSCLGYRPASIASARHLAVRCLEKSSSFLLQHVEKKRSIDLAVLASSTVNPSDILPFSTKTHSFL